MRRLFPIWIILIFASCQPQNSNLPEDVVAALKQAGKNRQELLAVINHYHAPEDSLKREAAYFLIGNMPGKYSEYYAYIEPAVEMFMAERMRYENLDVAIPDSLLDICAQRVDSLKKGYGYRPKKKYDLRVMTADYLIKNIDLAFEMWKKPWAKRFDFEQFCEYVLPYRVYHEPLSDWRPYLIKQYCHITDSLENQSDTEEIALYLNDMIGTGYITESINLPRLDAISADRMRVGECTDRYMLVSYAFRALGIPVMIDYTAQDGIGSKSHEWTVYLDTLSRFRPFDGGDLRRPPFTKSPPSGTFPSSTILPGRDGFAPTVFRYTDGPQSSSLAMQKKLAPRWKIPPFFRNPNLTNVTGVYEFPQFRDMKMDVGRFGIPKNKVIYLSVFGYGNNLREADWSVVRNDTVSFKGLGVGLVYVLCTYNFMGLTPVTSPFTLLDTTGTIRWFQPNRNNAVQEMTLTRKFSVSWNMKGLADNMLGAMFLGSDDPEFREADTLYTIDAVPEYMVEQTVPGKESYRYVRFFAPDSALNSAEIHFWGTDKDGNERLLTGEILHNVRVTEFNKPENLFDGSIRTNLNADPGSWVGLDLGEPTRITKVEYLSRNNFNVIEPGNVYELLYYNDREWISLGETVGKTQYLHYEQVPVGALFLLRNKTQGKEERVFTYEDGKQLWW